MSNLIKAELFKLSRTKGYLILIICAFAVGAIDGILPVIVNTQATGYFTLTLFLSYTLLHAMFGIVLAAIFICGDFAKRTYITSLFCGSTRLNIFLSKVFAFLIGLTPLLLIDPIVSAIIISIANGFGKELTVETCMEIVSRLFYVIINNLAMGGFFILIAMLFRKSIATIGIGMVIIHMLLTNLRHLSIIKFTFTYQMERLRTGESFSLEMFMGVSVITLFVTIFISALIFEKIELK